MDIRIVDLDGSICRQSNLVERCTPSMYDLRRWGLQLRLGCRFGRFARFERELAGLIGFQDLEPALTWLGSGDFHHVSLALLRRQARPFNLLVIDKHPDWVRGVPL